MDDPRVHAMLRIKGMKDIQLNIPGFNYDALSGGKFPPHEAVGIAYLTVAQRAMLLDPVGAGKDRKSVV